MYEICMRGGIKKIFCSNWTTDTNEKELKSIIYLYFILWSFVIEYQKKDDSIFTIIMILHIPTRLDIRKKWIQDLIGSLR